MNPIIFDFLIVLIVLISTLLGRHRGFILTLCGFLAIFVALIGSAVLTNLLAGPISHLALPYVENALTSAIQSAAGEASFSAEAAITVTAEQVVSVMGEYDLLKGLAAGVAQAVEQGAVDVTLDAAHAVALFLAVQLTRLVMFPVFFLLLMLAWTVLSHALDLAFRLPGLNFLNRTAGLLLGFARGVLLAYGMCWLLKDSYLPQSVIEGGFLLPYFCSSNPLLYISMMNS